jgi:hypothetical protein
MPERGQWREALERIAKWPPHPYESMAVDQRADPERHSHFSDLEEPEREALQALIDSTGVDLAAEIRPWVAAGVIDGWFVSRDFKADHRAALAVREEPPASEVEREALREALNLIEHELEAGAIESVVSAENVVRTGRAALAAREEPRTGISCGHAGPDDAICELPAGHDRLHLQRLERGYVEWER